MFKSVETQKKKKKTQFTGFHIDLNLSRGVGYIGKVCFIALCSNSSLFLMTIAWAFTEFL